ncbi:MAG: hypothetical protein JWN17_590 [Frankiales bacterium]|nr:hypothetical protein [Frankiales bacterium]
MLGIGGILLAGSLRFARGDQRVVVVTMERTPTTPVDQIAAARKLLKDECGSLPGVTVVADAGNPRVQGRFPVRFSIRGASNPEQAALEACLSRHDDVVRGYRVEGDE